MPGVVAFLYANRVGFRDAWCAAAFSVSFVTKYGAPEALVDVIRRLHEDFRLEFILDDEATCLIDYTVGVRQGDNMAPALFLFLMQAMAEGLRKEWA